MPLGVIKRGLLANSSRLDAALGKAPVIAILRGIRPTEAVGIGRALLLAGVQVVEVPLNSPDSFDSIELLVREFGDDLIIGAGTVMTSASVRRLAATGAQICVSPNSDTAVISAAVEEGLVPIPGFATPTEAFAAIAAGAKHLKLFPSDSRIGDIPALRAVLPPEVSLIAVGGVTPGSIPSYRQAGIEVFGSGSDLFKPGRSPAEVGERAFELLAAVRQGVPRVRRWSAGTAEIAESPVALKDGGVAWVDPIKQKLYLARSTENSISVRLAEAVFGLAMGPSGLVGTLERNLCLIANDGAITAGRTMKSFPSGSRLNDLTLDQRGGVWTGSMHRGLLLGKGALFHAPEPLAALRMVAAGLGAPNGMDFSNDGRLFVIDTLARTMLAFDADMQSGTLGEPVVIADFMGVPGKPDGMVRSSEGGFWVAMWGGACVVRIDDRGCMLERYSIPAPNVSSILELAPGHLLVTTSRMRLSIDQLRTWPGSGSVFEVLRE